MENSKFNDDMSYTEIYMGNEETHKAPEPVIEEETKEDLPFMVLLFNDDWHTFDEVINQIIKAINCSYEKARNLTFEVHVKGKAMVYSGSLNRCLRVTSVLEEIGLHTQIVS